MAVEPWELAQQTPPITRPRLELVVSPPPRGRPLAALLFVALLIGALGFPLIQTAVEAPAQPLAWSHRPPPASQIDALDPLPPGTDGRRPTSTEPAGGITFVSCTNLWTARPDGSNANKLLAFPGASSPAFSPDAKTIAFVGPSDEGPALFMVGADGGGLTEIGAFTEDGIPIGARVTSLSWSESGRKLAFALVDPGHDPAAGGSTIWTFKLETGEFERVADALPSAGFLQGQLVYSEDMDSTRDDSASFKAHNPNSYMTRRMSTDGDDLAFAAIPGPFSDTWSARHGTVLLSREGSNEPQLLVKRSAWRRGIQASHEAPSPYRFHPQARLSISQDGSRASADLIDPKGDRAVGILHLGFGEWTVLDYAWSAGFTPAPTSTGPVGARRAMRFASDVLQSWGRKGEYTAAAILLEDADEELITGGRRGFMAGTPEKTSAGWRVPATVYVREDGSYRYQRMRFELVRGPKGVLSGSLHAASEPHPLETLGDAKAFVTSLVGDEFEFRWPADLPAGAKLDPRWAVDAYSYDNDAVATVHLLTPDDEGTGWRRLNLAYGDVNFSMGCGGEMDPQEGTVDEEPALFDQMGEGPNATRQVLWPATLDARDGATYSIYGELPREELQRIADSMAP